MNLALEGIKVVDFSQVETGPICTQMLADFGADVLKVERLGVGDISRGSPFRMQGLGSNFLALNRNKKSLAVDLQQPEGKKIVLQLLREADVLVENFRPGVMDKLGLGYDHLSPLNARLVYATVTGFGTTGPYRNRKGQDIIAQALSGITTMNGAREDPPTLVGIPMADFAAGMVLCEGILMALLYRERTGQGQRIETSLLNGIMYTQLQDYMPYFNMGVLPIRQPRGGARPFGGPTAGVYRASDGYVVVQMAFSPGNPVTLMCKILGIADLAADPRFGSREKIAANYEAMRDIFAAAIAQRTVAEWVEAFEKADAMAAPAYSYREIGEDPQIKHNEMIVETENPQGGKVKVLGNPLKMYGTPWQDRRGPPALGGHTDEVLLGLGYTEEQVADLRQRKVVG